MVANIKTKSGKVYWSAIEDEKKIGDKVQIEVWDDEKRKWKWLSGKVVEIFKK